MPRPIKVIEPAKEILRLFKELVGGRPRQQPGSLQRLPALDGLFRRLEQAGRAQLDLEVAVPVVGRNLRVPYAYRNGALNLVKPQLFSESADRAIGTAERLAIEGDLLQRHGGRAEETKRLIIVSRFRHDGNGEEIQRRVGDILQAYDVKNVPEYEVPAFAVQVEREAH
jgi:hypothetical protein